MDIIQVYTPIDDLPKTVFGELTQHLENNAFIFLLLPIHCHSSISFSCDRTEIESDRERIESQKSIGGKKTLVRIESRDFAEFKTGRFFYSVKKIVVGELLQFCELAQV